MSTFELTIPRTDLVRVLSRAASVVNSKSPLPILQNMVLTAANGRLTAKATDLFLGTESSVTCDVKTDGSVAVDAKRAAEIAKSLGAGDVKLKLDKGQLTVKSGKSSFKLGTVPLDNFPSIPGVGPECISIGSVECRDLLRAIKQGSYAINTEDDQSPQALTLVTTNEQGLTVYSATNRGLGSASISQDGLATSRLLLPAKGVAELVRVAEGMKDGPVELAYHGSLLFVVAGDVTSSIKMGDPGSVHDMYVKFWGIETKRVIDKKGWTVNLPRDGVLGAIRRISIVASDKTGGNIMLTFSEGQLRVSASNQSGDEGVDVIDCDATFDTEREIVPKVLSDVLNAVSDDEVSLQLYGEISPLIITGAVHSDSKHIAMPISKAGR